MIVRCAGTADVISSVNFAREHGLHVAVRGGGHSFPGHSVCEGGLLIDLSAMKGIRVDPAARLVRAQPGVKWIDFDHETQAFGLATSGGTVSDTGIAGLTLGGRLGFLSSKHGLTIDNLVSADVVTADGRLLVANAAENSDLFWALRGGGGNFGIVTSFEYQLHSIGPTVFGGMIAYPLKSARDVLRFYNDFTKTAPDELTTYAGFLNRHHDWAAKEKAARHWLDTVRFAESGGYEFDGREIAVFLGQLVNAHDCCVVGAHRRFRVRGQGSAEKGRN